MFCDVIGCSMAYRVFFCPRAVLKSRGWGGEEGWGCSNVRNIDDSTLCFTSLIPLGRSQVNYVFLVVSYLYQSIYIIVLRRYYCYFYLMVKSGKSFVKTRPCLQISSFLLILLKFPSLPRPRLFRSRPPAYLILPYVLSPAYKDPLFIWDPKVDILNIKCVEVR